MGLFSDLIGGAINNYIEGKDKDDTLRTLVFLLGYHENIDREDKKLIVQAMKSIDEDASLFDYEDTINSIYNELKNKPIEEFFSDILSTRIDRNKITQFYTNDIIVFFKLIADETVKPSHVYNLYLLKKHFQLTRPELRCAYKLLADATGLDIDDVVEKIELLTSAEAIQELLKKYPGLTSGKIVQSTNNSDDDDDDDDDEITYTGNLEEGEQLLKKWHDISSRKLDQFFDLTTLTIEKDNNGYINFVDNSKRVALLTSNDFVSDEDGYFVILYEKNENVLICIYKADDEDKMEFRVSLQKGTSISLNMHLKGPSYYELQDFLDFMDENDIEIPDFFADTQREFIIELIKLYESNQDNSKFNDLDVF